MSSLWPWWAGGLSLTCIALGHWALTGRLLAVSGRITAIVDHLRHKPEPEEEMTAEDLALAIRAATAAEFGEDAVSSEPAREALAPSLSERATTLSHVGFLVSLVLGGLLANVLFGETSLTFGLHGEKLNRLFSGAVLPVVLVVGGLLVGFGTRMAGGCTSGHGLCGVSRLERGSLLSTMAFFGAGIGVSLLLGALI